MVLREKEKSWYISRIPRDVREEICKFAKEHFVDDYGMCLKFIWEKFKEAAYYQDNVDVKLSYIIQLLETEKVNKIEIEKKEEKPLIKMISGRKVKGGKKNE